MKTKYKILFILLFFVSRIFAQWDVYIGSTGTHDYGRCVLETYDKGYLIVSSEEGKIIRVTKTDINGNFLWEKSLSFENIDIYINSVIETSDGGYVLVGYSEHYDSFGDAIVIKFSHCFEKEWSNIVYIPNKLGVANDVIESSENKLLVLTQGNVSVPDDWINLFCFTLEGELLWEKGFAKKSDYPSIGLNAGYNIKQINNNYYINGTAYFIQSDIPDIYYIRPFIIAIDNFFNEKWAIPFGIEDTLVGTLRSELIFLNDTIYSTGTHRHLNNQEIRDPLIIKTNSTGEELGIIWINNDSIQENNKYGSITSIANLEDGSFIGTGFFNIIPDYNTHFTGKILFSSEGKVTKYIANVDTKLPKRMKKTFDNKYLTIDTYNYSNNTTDAHFHKFNQDLEPDTLYTQTFEYDYLCPETIESEDIQLDNCVPVGVEELPTPKEYYSYIATIPIHIYPNPASNIVHFELENTEHHKNILLQVYDLQSRPVFQTPIAKGQTAAQTDVSHWASGMYAVVVFSDGKVVGREKFVVR